MYEQSVMELVVMSLGQWRRDLKKKCGKLHPTGKHIFTQKTWNKNIQKNQKNI